MSPLSFTDEEMNSITELASALPPSSRDGFLKLIASNLSGYPAEARGPGLVHRIAAEAQRDFLKGGPIAVGVGDQSPWRATARLCPAGFKLTAPRRRTRILRR